MQESAIRSILRQSLVCLNLEAKITRQPCRVMLMDRRPYELPIPGPAVDDEAAQEVLRMWAAGGQPCISIDTECCEDSGGWGIVLVDIARHVAVAYELSGKMTGPAVLDRIKRTFDANWGKR